MLTQRKIFVLKQQMINAHPSRNSTLFHLRNHADSTLEYLKMHGAYPEAIFSCQL